MIKKANQKRAQNRQQQKPHKVITVNETTLSSGTMSLATQDTIDKMNGTLAIFEANEKKNQIKLNALNVTKLAAISKKMGSMDTIITVKDSEIKMSSAGKHDADQNSNLSKSNSDYNQSSESSQSQNTSLGLSQELDTSATLFQSGATTPHTSFFQHARNVFQTVS